MSTTTESPVEIGSDLNGHCPSGPMANRWEMHQREMKLVAPTNRKKYTVLVVGTGLGGGAAAASLAEQGYKVHSFCLQDTPRRAHSIAAQGGINAAKNYQNDGDSVWRLFYDTIKGGEWRARESNVYRLAQNSCSIIDQCVAQGVPFAREYGGTLTNRSFGGAQVSRTFYCKGQTGQQLLLGAYQSMMRQVSMGGIKLFTRREMLDVVVIDGVARGIITRNLITGQFETHMGDAVVLCTGGYGNVYYLSTNAKSCNVTAAWRAHRRGAYFANPCYTQIHPTCIPVAGNHQSKLTLMSESLRNDGRVWVPKQAGDQREPHLISDAERNYILETRYPSYGNLAPRDVSSRAAKESCDSGHGVGASGLSVYLDFADAIQRDGKAKIAGKYGNLFEMYARITGEDPYRSPMRIYPAVHYTMGGLWVDYNLQSNVKGLFVLGEANFSDHGANRLGASALMQGLSDGYFIIPYTIAHHLATSKLTPVTADAPAAKEALIESRNRIEQMLRINGRRTVEDFHRSLGKIMWNQVGMSRSEAGLIEAIEQIRTLRSEFWEDVRISGSSSTFNQDLEHAGRVADFLEFGELLAYDALQRDESCGGHFRSEHQDEEGECKRNDEQFCYVAAWESTGPDQTPILHKEPLVFEECLPGTRSYK